MCSTYRPATADKLRFHFGVAPPDSEFKEESYPGYMAPMIRRPHVDSLVGDRACALGMFGMVPHWADIKLARQTYNARTETVTSKPSFRNAYKRGQFCVLPVSSFYEPSYESGKAARWEIANAALRTGRFEQLVFLYFIGVAARLIRIEMDDGNWPPVARVAAPAFRMCGPCCLVHLVTIAQQPSSRPATD